MCATRGDAGAHTALLRSYEAEKLNDVDCTIREAARATSAASTFFDPIKIGPFGESFVDGATGCNNPVEKVFEEALEIWGPNARKRIQCLISVGTGQPAFEAFGGGLKEIAATIVRIATETEQTAEKFRTLHATTFNRCSTSRVYYRFNVVKGLEHIGLESYEEKARIAEASKVYLVGSEVSEDISACVASLKTQCMQMKHNCPFFRSVHLADSVDSVHSSKSPKQLDDRLVEALSN